MMTPEEAIKRRDAIIEERELASLAERAFLALCADPNVSEPHVMCWNLAFKFREIAKARREAIESGIDPDGAAMEVE
jgi:hypothetical protein